MSPSGLLLLDKPSGPTSHDMVNLVRRESGIRRVGHTGTLDPLASGLLVLLIGPATRLSEYLVGADKHYIATVRFGAATDTYDAQGRVVREAPADFEMQDLARALEKFRGEITQTPPPFSALKVKGKKAYELARAGKDVELAPRQITIYSLDLLEWSPPDAILDVRCSSGTYIRSLSHDLGLALECAAHVAQLRRMESGPFKVEQALGPEDFRRASAAGTWQTVLLPSAAALPDLPTLTLSEDEARMLARGVRIAGGAQESETASRARFAKAVTLDGRLAAVVEWLDSAQAYQPRKVFLESEDESSEGAG